MCANHCDFKIVLLGDTNVGKTSLVVRYIREQFVHDKIYATIGAAFCAKVVNSNGRDYTIGIWDTAGSERFDAMSRLYYRGAHAAILCYSPTNQESWTRLRHWLAELRNVEENCKIYLCGTKKDLVTESNRQVSEHIVNTYAQDLHGHMLVSSKTGENVENLFQKITDDCASDSRLMNELNRAKEKTVEAGARQQYSGCFRC